MATPSRRQRNHDWTASSQTRIYTRSPRQPRDEHTQFAKKSPRTRPAPIILAPDQPSPLLGTPLSKRWTSDDRKDTLAIPEVVDIADTTSWPRRGVLGQRSTGGRVPSPGLASPCSARQSEMSYGVLDYYMQDSSPLSSPKYPPTPRIETPVLGPAIDKFDFGLNITPSLTKSTDLNGPPSPPQDAAPGAERQSGETSQTPTIKSLRPKQESKRSYRLFPAVQEEAPTPITTSTKEPRTPTTSSIPLNLTFNVPHASYRPRKESISSSVRSRKDSLTSFSGTKRIPMRILSSSTGTSFSKGDKSSMSSTNSPSTASDSRWSDETITSPLVATTPGPRTSFADSLLRVESSGGTPYYPACFFEEYDEDDEAAPLRRKFPWKRTGNVREMRSLKPGRFDDEGRFGRRVKRVLLCAGCCG